MFITGKQGVSCVKSVSQSIGDGYCRSKHH